MDQEAANELGCGQPHDLLAVAGFDAVILPTEGDGLGIGADQAVVRDRHPMGIAAQVSQHGLGAAKGRFGVNHPFGFAERGEPLREGIRLRQPSEIAEEGQLTGPVQIHQLFQKQASKQSRQNPHMQKESRAAGGPRCAIG
jgi:hypothetical protein